jgi:hypothetical protein
MASSIVGTWNTFVDWGDTGSPIVANPLTFNADGSWTYAFGGGRWVQVEGMYFFNFTNAAGLVYTANVTRDVLAGIMGYATTGSNPGAGVWWGTHPGAPHAAIVAGGAAAAPHPEHDLMTAPAKK